MENLTIHNVPSELAQALQRESMRLRASLDDTVIELLRRALKIGPMEDKRNGLARLAGTWTADEHEQFEAAIAVTEQLDEDLWR
jgi:plasmid stability protein